MKFTRPPYRDPPKGRGLSATSGTFDLLGFTHYWVRFHRLLERYPLPPPVIVHSIFRNVAKR